MGTATPYTINVDQAVLDDLRRRLQSTRFPDHIPESGWDYGTEPSRLQARNMGSNRNLVACMPPRLLAI